MTLNNCLFGSVKRTKYADPDIFKYSDDGIGIDSRSEFSFTDRSIGKNVITFGADLSSVHIGNKSKYTLILCEGPTQGLHNTILTEKAIYPTISFTL